eukprot:gene16332-19428_t
MDTFTNLRSRFKRSSKTCRQRLRMNSDGVYEIDASINGLMRTFLFDSSSSYTHITLELATEAQLLGHSRLVKPEAKGKGACYLCKVREVAIGQHKSPLVVLVKESGPLVFGLDAMIELGLVFHAHRIPLASFLSRKQFFANKETGILAVKDMQVAANPMGVLGSAFKDQSGMTDMLKGNIVNVVPQVALMAWVNHFFSGFVAVRIPFFPLTIRFKTFLQRGIEMQSLDVSYVSSLSWYFLCWFGLEGINSLLLTEMPITNEQLLQSPLEQGAPSQQTPIHQLYTGERENLELIRHEWIMENVEQRFLYKMENNNQTMPENTPSSSSSSASRQQATSTLRDRRRK